MQMNRINGRKRGSSIIHFRKRLIISDFLPATKTEAAKTNPKISQPIYFPPPTTAAEVVKLHLNSLRRRTEMKVKEQFASGSLKATTSFCFIPGSYETNTQRALFLPYQQ